MTFHDALLAALAAIPAAIVSRHWGLFPYGKAARSRTVLQLLIVLHALPALLCLYAFISLSVNLKNEEVVTPVLLIRIACAFYVGGFVGLLWAIRERLRTLED